MYAYPNLENEDTAEVYDDDSGRPFKGFAEVIGKSNLGQASPPALGDETATWTKTMATGFLDSLVGF